MFFNNKIQSKTDLRLSLLQDFYQKLSCEGGRQLLYKFRPTGKDHLLPR